MDKTRFYNLNDPQPRTTNLGEALLNGDQETVRQHEFWDDIRPMFEGPHIAWGVIGIIVDSSYKWHPIINIDKYRLKVQDYWKRVEKSPSSYLLMGTIALERFRHGDKRLPLLVMTSESEPYEKEEAGGNTLVGIWEEPAKALNTLLSKGFSDTYINIEAASLQWKNYLQIISGVTNGLQDSLIFVPIPARGNSLPEQVLVGGLVLCVKKGELVTALKEVEIMQLFLRWSLAPEFLRSNLMGLRNYDSEDWSLLGSSPKMMKLKTDIEQHCSHNEPVLIRGESGTGKELVARELHKKHVTRSQFPYVPTHLGSISATTAKSELFGHKKGAFTGADEPRIGFIEAADKGTLFMDEIGDVDVNVQMQLFRVLEDKIVVPMGTNTGKEVDVRFIAATNANLEKKVQEKEFRQELLNRFPCIIDVPPLRDRVADIPALSDYLFKKAKEKLGAGNFPAQSIDNDCYSILMDYDWPANVRELGHVLFDACRITRGKSIGPDEIKEAMEHVSGLRASQRTLKTNPPPTSNKAAWRLHKWGKIKDLIRIENWDTSQRGIGSKICRHIGIDHNVGISRFLGNLLQSHPQLKKEVQSFFPKYRPH